MTMLPRHTRTPRKRGFTLVEMMITIAAIGLITAVAVPAFSGYLKRARVAGIRSQLVADMYYARSLAISNRRTFAVRFLSDRYTIVDTTNDNVMRRILAPQGVSFEASADPNFYAWGLADAADITLNGSNSSTLVSVLPTGAVDHD